MSVTQSVPPMPRIHGSVESLNEDDLEKYSRDCEVYLGRLMEDPVLSRSPNFILFLIGDDDVIYSAQCEQSKTWITRSVSDLTRGEAVDNVLRYRNQSPMSNILRPVPVDA